MDKSFMASCSSHVADSRHGTALLRHLWRGVLVLSLALWVSRASADTASRPAPDLKAGRAAYLQSCARCHGPQGHGDGLDAKRFYPRPRDLSMGVYKFRSTASGTPPTDEDLFQTITRGLPGSNMPDWQHLDEATRWQLVAYLKSLSPLFTQGTPEPVPLAADPGPAHADVAKGNTLYTQLGCASCHGPQGRANGPSAAGLVDDWGKKIRPADLTRGWNYRGGSTPRDVMLRVLTGIDGAGMPSYAGAVSPEDAWHLAYYVASLQDPPHWNRIAHAGLIPGALPTSWDDPRWAAAERTDLQVRHVITTDGEWVEPPTVSSIAFQVLANADGVALHMTWDDPSQDAQAPADALAVFLKPTKARGDVVTLQAWPSADGPTLDVCYWSAEAGAAHEMLSDDVARVITNPTAGAALASGAAYDDGRWHLVLQRPVSPAVPEGGASLHHGEFVSMGFAVWDGRNGGARAVSPWIDVVLPTNEQGAGSRQHH